MMQNLYPYYTVKQPASIECIIRKSRFLAHVASVQTREEAEAFLQQIRKQHPQATHNCYAYIIDPQEQKASDDGEPQGTAGRPILEIVRAKECIRTAVVVTRYFGGIKLGKGGLVRAYQQATKEVLEKAGIVQKHLFQKVLIRFPYDFFGNIEYHLHQSKDYQPEEPYFDQHVEMIVWIPITAREQFQHDLQQWGNGQVNIHFHQEQQERSIADVSPLY